MIKNFIIILGMLLFGCKDIYDPDVDTQEKALVIQGLLTNIPGQLVVRITQAVPFDSSDNRIPVRGAFVFVIDDSDNSIPLAEDSSGSYSNSGFIGEIAHTYYLKVVTPDGNTYISEPQTMPQSYHQDRIYAENTTHSVLVPTAYGDYFKTEKTGIETYVDLSSGGNELPKCRYDSRVTVLYTYVLGVPPPPPPPTVYCWKTFNPNTNINITLSRFDKTIGIISKHSTSFFGNNVHLYTEKENINLAGWLLTLTKYSLSKETYQYYLNMKNQLEASGKLFDPTPSQIIGNIKCINHPEKLVFGFFEVSYVEKLFYRYSMNSEEITLVSKDVFPGFTDEGELVGNYPPFWNY